MSMKLATCTVVGSSCAEYSFTAPVRFQNFRFIAEGGQGIVVRARDVETKVDVAIKKLQHIFEDPDGLAKRRAQLAYREFMLLTCLTHPNIIKLQYAYTPQDKLSSFSDIYLVMELQHCTLRHVIHNASVIPHKPLSFIVYQIAAGVNHLHNLSIIHRDLKPENIGFRSDVTIKILDLGLTKITDPPSEMTTAYVATRPYRAPELALGQKGYDEKVDVWSIGCIFAELILHEFLFRASSHEDLYSAIVHLLGSPPQKFFQSLDDTGKRRARDTTPSMGSSFEQIFPDRLFGGMDPSCPLLTNEAARSLLQAMLRIDRFERPSLRELAGHPYLARWFKNVEWDYPQRPLRYNNDFDEFEMSVDDWKRMLFAEVKGFQALQE